MTLDAILDKNYPIYKSGHPTASGGKDTCGYLPLYEMYLPDQVENFLEIGIAMGISIWMFRDYYESKGNFHAINMNWGRAGVIDKQYLTNTGIICHEGDQGNVEFLSTIKTQFDVIIDDGSHQSDHQWITFKHFFLNNVISGGLYVIEDLHCCLESYWWAGVPNFETTVLGVLRKYEKTGKLTLPRMFFTELEADVFTKIISKIHLHDPSIAFIYKI